MRGGTLRTLLTRVPEWGSTTLPADKSEITSLLYHSRGNHRKRELRAHMAKKYRLLPEGNGLYRLEALKEFSTSKEGNVVIHKGDLGGLVSSPYNLSQRGRCWVEGDARVLESAKVTKDALIMDKAVVTGRARVTDRSWVGGEARVEGEAQISGGAAVLGNAVVRDGATIRSLAIVGGNSIVEHRATVERGATVGERARVAGVAVVSGKDTVLKGDDVFLGRRTSTPPGG